MAIIAIKSWERFQHYKDRDPPWIKLYRDTLTSEAWVLGTDLSRLVQVASTMLAARYNNKIPYDFKLIKKVSSLDCTEGQFKAAIEHLIDKDFIEIQEVTSTEKVVVQVASTPLAKCSSEAEQRRAEKRRDREEALALARVVPGLDLEAFEKWDFYRGKSGKPIKPPSLVAAAEELAAFGDQQAIVVKHSIANSYQGLFAPKPHNGVARPAVVPVKLRTAEEWEEIERQRGESHAAN